MCALRVLTAVYCTANSCQCSHEVLRKSDRERKNEPPQQSGGEHSQLRQILQRTWNTSAGCLQPGLAVASCAASLACWVKKIKHKCTLRLNMCCSLRIKEGKTKKLEENVKEICCHLMWLICFICTSEKKDQVQRL